MMYPHSTSSKGTVQTVKASGLTDLFFFDTANTNAEDSWLQLFDKKLSSEITLGTTAPTLTFAVPAGDGTLSGGRSEHFIGGLRFQNGLHYAFTTTETGATANTANIRMNVGFG